MEFHASHRDDESEDDEARVNPPRHPDLPRDASGHLRAGLRIVASVLVYRLVRLEMANLVAAASLVIALRLPAADALVRVVFAFVLNVLAYTINDYVDRDLDQREGRAPEKTRFLIAHAREALWAQLALAAVLVAIALAHDPFLLVSGALGAGLCWVYTARWKASPGADVLAMTAWGAAMPLCAVPLDRPMGFVLIGQLALFSMCFEILQVMRDRESDATIGVRTTAVALGAEGSERLLRGAVVLAGVYAALFVHVTLSPLVLLAALVPTRRHTERAWHVVRFIFGLAWLGMLTAVYLTGTLDGWVGPAR